MAKSTWILSAVLATGLLGLVGCDGTPSPETTITCSSASDIGHSGPAGSSQIFFVVKVITIEDSGSGSGQQPGNGLSVDIYGDSEFIQFCEGRCDGADTFSNDLSTDTDNNGVLEYSVRLTSPPNVGSRAGSITEFFGNDSCTNTYSTATPPPVP